MATTPTTALPSVSPVRDPLKITFQDPDNLASDNEEPTELEVQVEVEDIQDSDQWKKVGEMLNPYGPTDTADVLIHRALMGALKPTPPNLTASGLNSYTSICKKYRLLARDVVGGIPTGNFEISGTAHAWLAGQKYTRQANELVGGRAYLFLQTQGIIRYLHPDQRIHIQFLTFMSGEDIKLSIEAQYTDSTTEEFEINLGNINSHTAYYITIPKPAFDPEKKLFRFSLRMFGFIGGSQGSMLFYYTRPTQWKQEIFYLNSLGGFENFMFTGKKEEAHTDTGEIFEGQLYPPLVAEEGNYQTFNQRSHESFTLRSGWINYAQREALKDLTLRNEAYMVVGSDLRKLIITNATYQTRKDGEFLYSLELQARFAYDQHAY
jgi:hypothetical protein